MWTDIVRSETAGRWDKILQNLCGLSEAETTPGRRGMPCPYCGGVDRYEFKSVDNGHYLCRGCGAGDGWSLVMKLRHCDFSEAMRQVSEWLHVAPREQKTIPSKGKISPSDRNKNHDRVAVKAQYLWSQSVAPDRRHPYLVAKQLPSNHFRQYKNCLVVPVFCPDGDLVNLQFIDPEGKKRFLKHGRMHSCFVSFGNRSSWSVYICEGVADALSIHLQYNRMAVAAFNADNIGVLVMFLRCRLPENRLVLFMDNDKPDQKRPWNPGVKPLFYHRYLDALVIPPPGHDASSLYVRHLQHGQRRSDHY